MNIKTEAVQQRRCPSTLRLNFGLGAALLLTGVQIHGSGLVLGAVGGGVVPVRLPIVVDGEQGEQDDGDNLQGQGQDGELEPHVGGVGRHPAAGVAYLALGSHTLTHTQRHAHTQAARLVSLFAFVFSSLVPCGGREEADAWF